MKTALFAVTLFTLGCSGNKDKPAEKPESPEVAEFKAAVKKFLADSKVVINAWEREASATDIIRYIDQGKDSFIAIPFLTGERRETSKRIIDDCGRLRFSLGEGKKNMREWVQDIENQLDALK